MSRRLVFGTRRLTFMSHRIIFVMHRVQSVHTSNSERTLGNFLVMWEIKFKMQFCNLAQLGLGNLTSFAISMYLFTIFHYTIGPFWFISENFAKSKLILVNWIPSFWTTLLHFGSFCFISFDWVPVTLVNFVPFCPTRFLLTCVMWLILVNFGSLHFILAN